MRPVRISSLAPGTASSAASTPLAYFSARFTDNRYQERAVANGFLMMCEVQGAKEDFIRRWNTIFKEYPDVFEDSDCRKIIHDLTEDAVQYLLKIKEKTL